MIRRIDRECVGVSSFHSFGGKKKCIKGRGVPTDEQDTDGLAMLCAATQEKKHRGREKKNLH